MKKYFAAFTAAALLLTGCQNDALEDQGIMEEGNSVVTFSAELPQSSLNTRALNSAEGGIVNMDWDNYQIRYIMEVYSADGNTLVERQEVLRTSAEEARNAEFETDLAAGASYQVAFWADFVSKGETTSDLYYNTKNGLDEVALTSTASSYKGNNDLRDAYFANYDITVNGSGHHQITLRRPFGKYRVITLDAKENVLSGVSSVQVSYTSELPTGLNVLTGELTTGNELQSVSYTANITEDNYSNEGNDLVVAFDYILAPPTSDEKPVQVPHNFSVTLLAGTSEVASYDFLTNIPIERNHLTTITGRLFTDKQDFDVVIDDEFDGEETVYGYKTAEEAEVGDFYLGNGQFLDGQEELTDEMKAEIIGVVFAPKNEADYSDYSFQAKGYVVALDNLGEEYGGGNSGEGIQWNSDVTAQLMPSADLQENSWLGYESMQSYLYYYDGELTLFKGLMDWAEKNPAPKASSGWFIPAAGQLTALMEAALNGGVNDQIAAAGGVTLKNNLTYWSSTEEYDQGRYTRAYAYDGDHMSGGELKVMWGSKKDNRNNARAILAY